MIVFNNNIKYCCFSRLLNILHIKPNLQREGELVSGEFLNIPKVTLSWSIFR